MRVIDRLAQRESSWRELEQLLDRFSSRGWFRSKARTADVVRLGELYRAACTDLMLAESHDLPRETVAYLHALVGRAHNVVYRAKGFRFSDLGRALFADAPRQMRSDPALRLAAAVFFGAFLICAALAAAQEDFATRVVGEEFVDQMDTMYAEPISGAKAHRERSDSMMAGFYVLNNTTIGLQCFAYGLILGLGSLYELVSNGIILGTVFGHMARSPHASNFFTFVTAHSSFELTAIVFAGAAGLRLGYGLIDTKGQTRVASLHREAKRALPTVGASVVLFFLAAFIEGFVSASSLPYAYKAAVAIVSALLLIGYLALGGRSRQAPADGQAPALEPR